MHKEKTKTGQSNKLCTSCRRTCKQASNAVVAKCPRYYPFSRKQTATEFNWKQMELALIGPNTGLVTSNNQTIS